MELEIIRSIQEIRNDFLDQIMKIITLLGDQYVFILIAAIIYWVVNKRLAFKITFVFLFVSLTVEFIKGVVRRPRPYVEDLSLSVGEPTHGYSFPSGHSQKAATLATTFYLTHNKKISWLKYITFSLVILVAFSRLYLGQHYLTDVIGGILIGVIGTIGFAKIVDLMKDKEDVIGLIVAGPMLIFLIIFGLFPQQYENVKDTFVSIGALVGFLTGYYLESRYLKVGVENLSTKNVVLRLIIGFVGVLVVYIGLSLLFDKIAEDNFYLDAIRYGLVALWVSFGSMFIYKKTGI